MFSVIGMTLLVIPMVVSILTVAMVTAVTRLVPVRFKFILLMQQILLNKGIVDDFYKIYLLLIPRLVSECMLMALLTATGSRLMTTASWFSMLMQRGCPSSPNTRYARRTKSIQL